MKRFRREEWLWAGVIGVAFAIMAGVTVWPWIAAAI